MKKYLRNLYFSWLEMSAALIIAFFCFLHGLLPCRFTTPEYWDLWFEF